MNAVQLDQYLNEAEKVLLEHPINIRVGLVKDGDHYTDEGLVKGDVLSPNMRDF